MLENRAGRSSGIGSWPGTDVKEAVRTAFGELGDGGVPYLAELPGRGPGADLLGRGAVFLVETPVDLQPSGWRLVSRPGRDLQRAQSMLGQDLDVLAEVADGYAGPLKLQVTGPWTLAAGLHLPRLERAVVDPGACRDIVAALSEGVSQHVRQVARLVPDAQLVLQLDEPSISAVLGGTLPSASGMSRLRPVDLLVVRDGLRAVLAAATSAGAVETVVHCCAPNPPSELFLRAGADGVSVDLGQLDMAGWEVLAPAVEEGRRLWAGAVPTSGPSGSRNEAVDAVWTPWRRLGLETALLESVIVTPACGLAGLSPSGARSVTELAARAAKELAARAAG